MCCCRSNQWLGGGLTGRRLHLLIEATSCFPYQQVLFSRKDSCARFLHPSLHCLFSFVHTLLWFLLKCFLLNYFLSIWGCLSLLLLFWLWSPPHLRSLLHFFNLYFLFFFLSISVIDSWVRNTNLKVWSSPRHCLCWSELRSYTTSLDIAYDPRLALGSNDCRSGTWLSEPYFLRQLPWRSFTKEISLFSFPPNTLVLSFEHFKKLAGVRSSFRLRVEEVLDELSKIGWKARRDRRYVSFHNLLC